MDIQYPMPFATWQDTMACACFAAILAFLGLCWLMARRDKRRWAEQDERIEGKR